MALEQGGLCEEPRFAGTAAADDQDIFIPGVLRLLRAARHCDPLRLGHGDVVEKILIHEGGNIRRGAPPGAAVFHTVAVFLRVLALHVDRRTEDHRPGYADQKVRKCKTQSRRSKRRCETVPDGEQLAGQVRTGCQPESLGQLIKRIHEKKVRKICQNQFFHVHRCTLRSLTFTFSRSMVRCSAFCAAWSFA